MAGGIREDPPGVQWIDSVPGFRCAKVSTAASRSQGSILVAAASSPIPRVVSNAGAAKFPGRFLALPTQIPGVGRKGETSKAPGRLPSARWRGDGWGRKAGGNRPDGAKTGSSTPGLHANGARMRIGLARECCIIRFRPRMRRQVGITRLILHLDVENLEKYGEEQLGELLTELAVVRDGTTGTQNKHSAPFSFTTKKSSVSG